MAAKKKAKSPGKARKATRTSSASPPKKKGPPAKTPAKRTAAKKPAAKKAARRSAVEKSPAGVTAASAARTPSGFGEPGNDYLPQMYKDCYYPVALVDKVKEQLAGLVALLEQGPHPDDVVQAKCDEMTDAINALEEEFDEEGSELETVAREDIAETLGRIFEAYDVELELEDALRKREW